MMTMAVSSDDDVSMTMSVQSIGRALGEGGAGHFHYAFVVLYFSEILEIA